MKDFCFSTSASVVPVGTKLVNDVTTSDSAHLLAFYREFNKEFHNTASRPLRSICQSAIDLLKQIVQEHGHYRATAKTNEVRPQHMDAEIFTDRYVLDRLAVYIPGLLIEERKGISTLSKVS